MSPIFLFNFLFILAISFSLSRISSFVSNILFFYSFSSWCLLDGALRRAIQKEESKWKHALTIVRSFDNASVRSWISWIDFSWLSSFCSYSFCSLFKSTRDLKIIDRWRTLVQFLRTPLERFQFRWLKIKEIYAALPNSVTLFSNHLKWNSPGLS